MKKYKYLFVALTLILISVLTVGAASAQEDPDDNRPPNSFATPEREEPPDTDGDGLPDRDDGCPRQPGSCGSIVGLDNITIGDTGATADEDPEWWGKVMDLMCPGDWFIILGTNEAGEEIVTDAQCD